MNIFQKRIENLCDEIIGRILALMQANSVSEVILRDNNNPVYVIWFDKTGDPCECFVHKVTAAGKGIILEVHDKITGENYKVTSRHEAALANPIWLNEILSAMTDFFPIKIAELKEEVICGKCGGNNIISDIFFNLRTKESDYYINESFINGWCDDCKKSTVLSNIKKVKTGIDNKYREFTDSHNKEPELAECLIVWKDTLKQ